MTKRGQQSPASARSTGEDRADPLARLRREIDAVDDTLLERLNQRASLVTEVGRIKRRDGSALYEPAREREIVGRLAAANPGPFPNAALPHVFREVISATRSLEGPTRVAYLGPEGTFCHLAARQQFGAQAHFSPAVSIPDTFAEVERGNAEYAVVPVENTTEGVVTHTLDTFVESELNICGEVVLRISENLLSQSGLREKVRRVASHPQPLAQCRQWLDRHLPGAERVETSSTAAAAQLAAADADVAAIASELAAEVYGLETVASSIEDQPDNTTRFFVIGGHQVSASGDDLTCAVFTLRRDQSGALHRLLAPFAKHGVNLTSIQSRPLKGKPWEYQFFVDLEGHREDDVVAKALDEAAECAFAHRILGSFPRAASRTAQLPKAANPPEGTKSPEDSESPEAG